MVVVEDKWEVGILVGRMLGWEYGIVEGGNGMEGVNKGLKFVGDIIMREVMMGEKEGMGMRGELGGDMSRRDIGIVLVRGKWWMESKLEGLE